MMAQYVRSLSDHELRDEIDRVENLLRHRHGCTDALMKRQLVAFEGSLRILTEELMRRKPN